MATDVGRLIDDRFEIVAVAGLGGMGTVYRAQDRHAGGDVALKLIHAHQAENHHRFVREGRLLETLSHPGIVRHVAHGRTPDGELYLAMEWLEGEDLAHRLRRAPLSAAEAVGLARLAAGALAVAHAAGVVHRDLKPSNLFLVDWRADRVKILDFGVARQAAGTRATRTGALIGTPSYMAPEQARGEADVDARADVFALGCVLFECLAGRAPFAGDHELAVLAKLIFEDAPRLRDVHPDASPALDDLLAAMLAKDPAGRPCDAAALASRLSALGGNEAEPVTRPGSAPPAVTNVEHRLLCVVMAGSLGNAEVAERDEAEPPTQSERPGPRPLAVPTAGRARLAALRASAGEFGARLEVLVGGSVVAALSLASAATDLAARAARLALAMRDILPGAPIALATGRADVTGGFPAGAIIDRAAALLPPADAPAIRLDAVTAGLLDARFEVAADAASPVLVAERAQADAMRTLLGKPTPCVGRERELVTLDAVFAECRGEPVARAVLLTGKAGMGKSRLRYEFLRRVRQSGSPVEIWIARGDPMRSGSPYGLLVQALRGAAGIRDGEPLDVRRERIRARVERNLPPAEAARVSDFFGELLSASFPDADRVQLRAARQDARLMGDQIRRAVQDFVAAECAVQPVVLVLEDLQWGDTPTVKMVDSLLRTLADAPLFVLGLARPEVVQLFPSFWRERGAQEIQVGELTRKAAERLVRWALGEVREAEVARLVELAGGNAFYLEELIRAVAEGNQPVLPATVIAMAEARLGALEPDVRRILRAASVFGEAFWDGAVRALVGRTGADVGDWLCALAEREIVTRRGAGRFPREEEYVFRHALLREVAYATLGDDDRRAAHRSAGEWLEAKGETDSVALAEHFERGGDPARAARWYRRAADEALGGNDLEAALARGEGAVRCGAAGEALGEVRLIQAEAYSWRSEHRDQSAAAGQAVDLLPPGSARWWRALRSLAEAQHHQGDHAAVAALSRTALGRAKRVEPTREAVIAVAEMALMRVEELGDALVAEMEAFVVTSLSRLGHPDPEVTASVERYFAFRACFANDLVGALEHSEAGAAAYELAGDLRSAIRDRVNCGYTRVQLGDLHAAERALREALAVVERMENPHLVAHARQNLGYALVLLGRHAEGEAMLVESLAHYKVELSPFLHAGSRLYLAMSRFRQGDLEAATREARAAEAYLASFPAMRASALALIARIELAAGRATVARAAAGKAMDILAEQGAVEDEALVRLAWSEALAAGNEHEAARAAIELARNRILARAGEIRDPRLRRSFLEQVEENARVLALAAAGGPQHGGTKASS